MRELSKRIFARSKILQIMPYSSQRLSSFCQSCIAHECLQVCPEKIIVLDSQSLPTLSFVNSGCVFCGECYRVCFEIHGEHEGFDPSEPQVNARMQIDPLKCLSWNGSICSSCKDVCPCKIEFVGMFYPEVRECVGCGLCISKCPLDAIKIKRK